MLFAPLLFAALVVPTVQQQPAPATQPPSPIARLVISPARREVAAGDTLRLRAEAYDSAGRPVPGVTIRFVNAGGYFEAQVDSTGLVSAGATGVKPVSVIALAPGAKPFIERVEVRILPGAAARVTLAPRPARLLAGQIVQLEARSFSDVGDERGDRIVWAVSVPSVANVDATGLLTAVVAGRTRISARAGNVTQSFDLQVLPNAVASVTVTPARTDARQELLGDLRAQGREIAFLNIADMDATARAPNTAMTWGVVVKNGLAYIGDIYSGLWIVRIEPKNKIVP